MPESENEFMNWRANPYYRAIIEEITRFLPLCLDPVTPATVVALAMAQPYAGRPGWDPAWRVEP